VIQFLITNRRRLACWAPAGTASLGKGSGAAHRSFTFGYLDQAKATNARSLIEKAIVEVALITAAGAHE
jgi:hypothetical protein